MRRRDLIALFGGGLVAGLSGDWPVESRAQQSSMAKVGLLWPGPAPPVSPRLESFRDGLQRSGYIEGQNIAFELRYGAAVPQQLADQASELVRAKVDVIATFGDSATKIAQDATGTIPIVALGDDLLGSGLIGRLSRVAGLWDPSTGPSQVGMSENAARAMKLKLQIFEIRRSDDLDGAFRAARDGQLQAISVFSSPFLSSLYREIIDRAAKYRLPAIYQWREHVEAGGLMAYGPSLPAMWQQDGALVAKILKGAKPSDLPVEQPSKFELVINIK